MTILLGQPPCAPETLLCKSRASLVRVVFRSVVGLCGDQRKRLPSPPLQLCPAHMQQLVLQQRSRTGCSRCRPLLLLALSCLPQLALLQLCSIAVLSCVLCCTCVALLCCMVYCAVCVVLGCAGKLLIALAAAARGLHICSRAITPLGRPRGEPHFCCCTLTYCICLRSNLCCSYLVKCVPLLLCTVLELNVPQCIR